MPDIQFFDAASFFAQKISETEQTLIHKKAEWEILISNRRSLDSAITSLATLNPEQQQAISGELTSLREVRVATDRTLAALEAEVALMSSKLAALRAANDLVRVEQSP